MGSELLDLSSVFLFGLSASFAHCIGMCGGFIIALNQLKSNNMLENAFNHIFYQCARILMYVILGAIVGGMGSIFIRDMEVVSIFKICINTLLILIGFSIIFFPVFLHLLEPNFATSSLFQGMFSRLYDNLAQHRICVLLLGFLNGLIPCSMVYTALLASLQSGDSMSAARMMLVFGVGTLPSLLLLIFFATTFKRFLDRYAFAFRIFSGLLIIGFGAYNLGIKYFL